MTKFRPILKLIAAMAILVSIIVLALWDTPAHAHPALDATPVSDDLKNPKYLKDPCPADPNDLLQNASMDPGGDSQYGSLAASWQPFIFSDPAPSFRWVNNEGIYKGQSQQIYSSNVFDAGIYQVVPNLQPGTYYWFRLGWAPAAKSIDGPNVESSAVGRKVGVDPFGGTDPKSPNVIWGQDYMGDTKGLNRNALILLFAARSTSATIYMRALARDGGNGENRVWFNAPCMEARPELPTATPAATATSTATAVPPTATRRPPVTRPPVTQIAQAPTAPPDTAVPTAVNTPTPAATAAPSDTPRFARPEVTPEASLPVDPGVGILAGVGGLLIFGAFSFFIVGLIWWKRMN